MPGVVAGDADIARDLLTSITNFCREIGVFDRFCSFLTELKIPKDKPVGFIKELLDWQLRVSLK